jgi:hypothetical protein
MAYYNTCARCGATLDTGEKCTCIEDEKRAKEQAQINKMVNFTKLLLNNSKSKKRGKRK